MSDGHEYSVSYLKDGIARRETFSSELAALGRAATLMRAGGTSEIVVTNPQGQQIHDGEDIAVVCALFSRGHEPIKARPRVSAEGTLRTLHPAR